MSDQRHWRNYLAAYHTEHPSVTEQLLGHVEGRPYEWLVAPLREVPGLVVDLACGSAPTRDHLRARRWVGVDNNAAELAAATAAGRGPVVRATAEKLPFADGCADAVCAALCLQVLTPMREVLAEITRVLRPGGMLTALVPSGPGLSASGWLGWLRIVRAIGAVPSWPNPQACDGLARVLRQHGFVVRQDQRHSFPFPLRTPDSAGLLLDGLYLPRTDPERLAEANRALAAWTRPGRLVPLPLRRVVAQRA